MKILVVSNRYPPAVVGGYEVECAHVVSHLRTRHDVYVLTSDVRPHPDGPEPGVRRGLRLFTAGTKAESLRAPAAARPAADLMRATLRGFRPDLAFVWNGAGIPHAALRVLDAEPIPLAYRICEHWFGRLYTGDLFLRHLLGDDDGVRWAWAQYCRAVNRLPGLRLEFAARRPVGVLWNSEYMKSTVPVPAVYDAVLEEVLLPVTPRVDALDGIPRDPDPEPSIICVGRVSPEKGPDVVATAQGLLASDGLAVRVRFAGPIDPGTRSEVEGIAAAAGASDRIEFLGPLDEPALKAAMGRASLTVIASVWDEPAPMTALEAARARLPIVASRVGGIPEVLRDGQDALFFERADAAGCARAVAETLRDPAAAASRVQSAYGRAREFTFPRYLEATDAFLAAAASLPVAS